MLLKHILFLAGAMIVSVAAAPVPSGDKSLNVKIVRDLEQVVAPVLQAAQPLADGADQGLTNLGNHVSSDSDAAGVYPFFSRG